MARLVTLDVTNTCIRVAKSVGHHYARVAQEFDVMLEESKIDKAFRLAFKETNTNFPNFGCQHNMSTQQWWHKVVSATLSTAGAATVSSVVLAGISERLYTGFTGAENWLVFPDVQPALQQMKAAGVLLGAISNFDERLSSILASLDLAKYFDFVLASSEVKTAKPDPRCSCRIFQLALEKASAQAKDALHVGDSYELDYVAARKAGLDSLLLVREETERNGVEVIHTLLEMWPFMTI